MPGAQPYSLRNVMQHPLARMLPMFKYQQQVYRLAEKHPPSNLAEYAPTWETMTFDILAYSNGQARITVQKDFTLLAISLSVTAKSGGASASGAVQFYDVQKQRRFADRPVQAVNIGNPIQPLTEAPWSFLREPYHFDLPNSQILVMAQNLSASEVLWQLSLYGVALRFNQDRGRP